MKTYFAQFGDCDTEFQAVDDLDAIRIANENGWQLIGEVLWSGQCSDEEFARLEAEVAMLEAEDETLH